MAHAVLLREADRVGKTAPVLFCRFRGCAMRFCPPTKWFGTPRASRGSFFERLARQNLDAEPCESHIGEFASGQQPDRRNPKILEDLGAESHFAPLPRARFLRTPHAGLRNLMRRHAR